MDAHPSTTRALEALENDLPPVVASRSGDGMLELILPLIRHWGKLALATLLGGALAFAGSYLVPNIYTARVLLLPPQPQGGTGGALSSLGMLSTLIGIGARSTGDQYVALLLSRSVSDRIIDRFDLMRVYDVDMRVKARQELELNVSATLGKKDGLIAIEIDDRDPKRAAAMANSYVDELRGLTNTLAVTEAQQRRQFFEQQLRESRDRLTRAQEALQASGFSPGALKAEPRAAAEGYARIRAELSAAEVRLQALRASLADATPEVRQMQSIVQSLRVQLAQAERAEPAPPPGSATDYVGKYREFKYQETLFELMARQYEIARVDESREGALIQVVDAAAVPERKSRPKRSLYAVAGALGTLLLLSLWMMLHGHIRRVAESDPEGHRRWLIFRRALWR